MKPTAPSRCDSGEFATDPAVAYLFLVRPMTRALSLLATIFVACSAVAADEDVASVAQGRDLRAYDNGGVYQTEINAAQFNEDHVTDVQKLREFVWTHWTQKRRGYVHVVYRYIDFGTNTYLFIEPHDGKWRIAWRDFHYRMNPVGPTQEEYQTVDAPEIVTVERCRGSLIFFDADDQIIRYP